MNKMLRTKFSPSLSRHMRWLDQSQLRIVADLYTWMMTSMTQEVHSCKFSVSLTAQLLGQPIVPRLEHPDVQRFIIVSILKPSIVSWIQVVQLDVAIRKRNFFFRFLLRLYFPLINGRKKRPLADVTRGLLSRVVYFSA